MASIKDVLEHLVTHATGYPTQADRQAHLDAVNAAVDDGEPAEPAGGEDHDELP